MIKRQFCFGSNRPEPVLEYLKPEAKSNNVAGTVPTVGRTCDLRKVRWVSVATRLKRIKELCGQKLLVK